MDVVHTHDELHADNDPSHTHAQFASDDLSLVLGIAIGVPLGAAYLAVHNGAPRVGV